MAATDALDPEINARAKRALSGQPALDPQKTGVLELDDTEKRVKAFNDTENRIVQNYKDVAAETRRRNEILDKRIEETPIPQFKPIPYEPPKQGPVDLWGSWALVFAALASGFTRSHATTALNAAASAINGMTNKNKYEAEQAYKQWQTASENMFKAAEYEQKTYQNIVSKYERRIKLNDETSSVAERAMQAELNAAAHSFQNETILKLGLDRGVQAQINEIDRQGREIEKGKERTAKLEDQVKKAQVKGSDAYKKAIADHDYETAENMLAAAGDEKALAKAQSQQDVNKIALGIEAGKQPPVLTGLYGKSPAVRAKLEDDGFDLSHAQLQFEAAKKQVASLNGPQMVRFVGLAKSVVNTIDEVRRLSGEMQLSGVPALNKAELQTYIQAEGNSPNGQLAVKYLTAVNTLKSEFANVEQGGYAPHESVWDLAKTQINENYGIKEMNASLTEIQRLLNYRINSFPGMGTYGPGSPNQYTGTDASGDFDQESTKAAAKEAIRKGGDRDRIIQKMKDAGLDTSGL